MKRVATGMNGAQPPHRSQVGGLWEEIGTLQCDYLIAQGLAPHHRLLDVGCGCLRGGVKFVRYLDSGRYFGMDLDPELLSAGRRELQSAGLGDRTVSLLADDGFRFGRFGETFDFAIAHSVFSHLSVNSISRCLAEIEGTLAPGGTFFATFFPSPGPRLRSAPLTVEAVDGQVEVYPDADPYFYDPDLFRWLCEGSTLVCHVIGPWGHPRGQEMLSFAKLG